MYSVLIFFPHRIKTSSKPKTPLIVFLSFISWGKKIHWLEPVEIPPNEQVLVWTLLPSLTFSYLSDYAIHISTDCVLLQPTTQLRKSL